MPEAHPLVRYACPKCGAEADLDTRFVQWCASCGHGADPYPPSYTKRQAARRERGRARSERLLESLKTAKDLRPTSATGVAVTALSAVVHLIGVLVLVAPVLWIVSGASGFWPWVAAVFGVLLFWTVRPRLPMRRLKDDFGFHQVMAPEFFALLDRCAAELGCKAPDRVAVRSDYNAATGRAGLAQRSFLLLGAPLWTVLSGPERVALLGHELAHQVNGDATHGTWALSARRSLSEWTKLLDPRETGAERAGRRRLYRSGRAGQAGLASMLAPLLMTLVFAPFFLIAVGCRALLLRLDLQCGQRAEYLADDLGSRLAGSAATEGLLCKLVFRESLTPFVNARRARRPKPSPELLWSDFRDYVESIPEYEFQRRIVLDRLHGTRIDRTHPANHHRIALTGARPRRPGVVTVTDEQWAAIDAELAPYLAAAAKRALS